MDCAFGVAGEDWVIIGSDRAVVKSIIKLQDTDDKLRILSDNQIISCCGEVADRKEFSKLVNGEMDYYYYRYNKRLSTDELANYTRSTLAESLRKKPYQVNCLISGFDEDGAKLYWLDYLGSMQRVLKGSHGYGGNFLYGIMDNHHKKVITNTKKIFIKNILFIFLFTNIKLNLLIKMKINLKGLDC